MLYTKKPLLNKGFSDVFGSRWKAWKWRRGELNPRPDVIHCGFYVRSLVFLSRRRVSHRQDARRPARAVFDPRLRALPRAYPDLPRLGPVLRARAGQTPAALGSQSERIVCV